MYEYITNYGHNCLYVSAVTVAAWKARPSILSHEQSRSSTDRIGTDISIRSHFAECRGILPFPIFQELLGSRVLLH